MRHPVALLAFTAAFGGSQCFQRRCSQSQREIIKAYTGKRRRGLNGTKRTGILYFPTVQPQKFIDFFEAERSKIVMIAEIRDDLLECRVIPQVSISSERLGKLIFRLKTPEVSIYERIPDWV